MDHQLHINPAINWLLVGGLSLVGNILMWASHLFPNIPLISSFWTNMDFAVGFAFKVIGGVVTCISLYMAIKALRKKGGK